MDFMSTYQKNDNGVIRVFMEIQPEKINPQIVLLCQQGITKQLSIKVVLAQYKYCLEMKQFDSNYEVLKGYLSEILSEEEINKLEVAL